MEQTALKLCCLLSLIMCLLQPWIPLSQPASALVHGSWIDSVTNGVMSFEGSFCSYIIPSTLRTEYVLFLSVIRTRNSQ